MARPKFIASQEIRDMVKSGSMIGATWEHIAINVSDHLEEKYQKAKFVNEKAAKNNEPEPFNLAAMPRKVSKRTLQRTCQEDYDDGVPVLHAKLTSTLMQNALSGHPASIFFALKTRFGWKETTKQELSGPDGQPIEHNASVEHNGQIDINDSEQLEELMSKMDEFLEKSF